MTIHALITVGGPRSKQRSEVARRGYLEVELGNNGLGWRTDGRDDNRTSGEIAEDVGRTRRSEGDDCVCARDAVARLLRHRVRVGARRNVHRDHWLAAAVDGPDGVGIEALDRWLKSRAEYRINDEVAISQAARGLSLKLLRILQNDGPKRQALEHGQGIAAQFGW